MEKTGKPPVSRRIRAAHHCFQLSPPGSHNLGVRKYAATARTRTRIENKNKENENEKWNENKNHI
jgi:hypothetical protein